MAIETELICGICATEAHVVEVDRIRTVTVWAVRCKSKSCKQEGPRFGFLVTGNPSENDRLAKEEATKGWIKIHGNGRLI